MKSPDEIKKGLEYLRITNVSEKVERFKQGLPYAYTEEVAADALALIQQLEARAHQLDLLNVGLLVEKAQLEAERDAAIADLKSYRCCHGCKHLGVGFNEPCLHCDFENNCFEWRGPQKENH